MTNVYAIALWVCAVGALAVFGTMIYSIVAFRRPREASTVSARNKLVEVMWALIPIAIVCFAALPAAQSVVTPEQPSVLLAQSSFGFSRMRMR